MPTPRKHKWGNQYGSFGTGISGSKNGILNNSRGGRGASRPTVRNTATGRGSYSVIEDTSIRNHKLDYQRALNLHDGAANAAYSSSNSTNFFDGNAAFKIEPASKEKPKFQPDYSPKPNKKRKIQLEAIKGQKQNGGILSSAALSPMLVTIAKFITSLVVIAAIAAFLRVAISAASVSTSIESRQLATEINQQLANKNQLEVESSAVSNSGKIRSAANQYALVAPASKEQINLGQDVVAYDKDGNISLVESIKRVGANK